MEVVRSVMTVEQALEKLKEQRRSARQAVKSLIDAIDYGDVTRFDRALTSVIDIGMLVPALRKVSELIQVAENIRFAFLTIWENCGDSIRDAADHNTVLPRALRMLLPEYIGSSIVLFRGEAAFNRRRRSYGMSWTADRYIAESFARGVTRTHDGGSVVLRCEVPANAIICAPALLGDAMGELEYIVDRRHLKGVTVVDRFSQIAYEDFAATAHNDLIAT